MSILDDINSIIYHGIEFVYEKLYDKDISKVGFTSYRPDFYLPDFDGNLFKPQYGIDFGVIVFDEKDGFGYQIGADDLSHNALKEAYSDHRPLWFRFNTSRVSDSDSTNALQKFFTTKSGKRYHLHNCPSINASSKLKAWESIEQLQVESYLPCKIYLD